MIWYLHVSQNAISSWHRILLFTWKSLGTWGWLCNSKLALIYPSLGPWGVNSVFSCLYSWYLKDFQGTWGGSVLTESSVSQHREQWSLGWVQKVLWFEQPRELTASLQTSISCHSSLPGYGSTQWSRRTELLLSPIPKSYSWNPQSTDLRIPCLAEFAGGCYDPEKNAGGPGTPYSCSWASHRVLLCGRATTSGMLGTGIRPSLHSPAHPLLCCSNLEFASSCAQMFHAREWENVNCHLLCNA